MGVKDRAEFPEVGEEAASLSKLVMLLYWTESLEQMQIMLQPTQVCFSKCCCCYCCCSVLFCCLFFVVVAAAAGCFVS